MIQFRFASLFMESNENYTNTKLKRMKHSKVKTFKHQDVDLIHLSVFGNS